MPLVGGAAWIGVGVALWLGALAGGGHPHVLSWDWPFLAIDFLRPSIPQAYWHLSGTAYLRSPNPFNEVAIGVLTLESAIGLLLVTHGPSWLPRIAPGLVGTRYQGWASRWHVGRLLVSGPEPGRVRLGNPGPELDRG